MRWQQILGVLLGLFVVGPLIAGLLLGDNAGGVELMLSGLVGAVVGYFVSGALSSRSATH